MKLQLKRCLLPLVALAWATVCLLPRASGNDTELESTTLRPELETFGTVRNVASFAGKMENAEDDEDSTVEASREMADKEDDEEGDGDEEEEGCDSRLSSMVRTFDGAPYLPDDYQELAEGVTELDFAQLQYNVTDMLAIIRRGVNWVSKLTSNKDLMDTGMYLSSLMMDKLYEAKVSAECTADLANVASELRNGAIWAPQFLDSFGLPPTGVLSGAISGLGEYEQCRRIRSPVLENGRRIYGQYCKMQLRSIDPDVETITKQTEGIFRSDPYVQKAIKFAAEKLNMDKLFVDKGDLLRIAKELLDWGDVDKCFFHLGLCFPASCSAAELELVLNQIIYPIIKTPVSIGYCEPHEDLKEDKLEDSQWMAITIWSSVAGLTFLSTLYHAYLLTCVDPKTGTPTEPTTTSTRHSQENLSEKTFEKKETALSKDGHTNLDCYLHLNVFTHACGHTSLKPKRTSAQKTLLAFSAIANTQRLLQSKPNSPQSPLVGLQLLLTFGLFASQSFTFPFLFTPQLVRNWAHTVPYRLLTSDAYWFARTPSIWADGLIFLLGVSLLLSQFALLRSSRSNQGQAFGYFAYLLGQWAVLSAPIVGALCLVFLLPLVGDGPFWYLNRNWLWPSCTYSRSLTSTFLYYSNWNPTLSEYVIKNEFSVCNPPTWFFSVSSQLYLVAPLVFLPLYRWPRLGLPLLLVLLLASPLATLAPRLLSGTPTLFELTEATSLRSLLRSYHTYTSNTFQYATSLLLGLLTGYTIDRRPQLPLGGPLGEGLLWCLSLLTLVLTFAWNNTFWVFNQENDPRSVLAWLVVSKFTFGGSLGYITYMSATSRARFLNPIISLLQPLGKLSSSILMLSGLTILYRITSQYYVYEMRFGQTLQNTIADFGLTTCLAYCLYLLFEGPARRLVKLSQSLSLLGAIRPSTVGSRMPQTDSIEELKSGKGSPSESRASFSNGL